tara:strand:+ start:315 stop:809 length:495 start_codon:yes stop_codon:yes gene_type:complete
MKSIILFRHGDADISFDYKNDHERPLVKKGIEDAKMMGQYLSRRGQLPDLVISSTAVRAKTTIDHAMNAGKWFSKLILEAGIYGGSPSYLLRLLHNQDNNILSICLVGHEPNFSNFISQSTESEHIRFPTASMAKVTYDINNWSEVTMGFGNLDWIVNPQNIKI